MNIVHDALYIAHFRVGSLLGGGASWNALLACASGRTRAKLRRAGHLLLAHLTSSYLPMADEPGKRHDVRAH